MGSWVSDSLSPSLVNRGPGLDAFSYIKSEGGPVGIGVEGWIGPVEAGRKGLGCGRDGGNRNRSSRSNAPAATQHGHDPTFGGGGVNFSEGKHEISIVDGCGAWLG